jgi:hypothetical protein
MADLYLPETPLPKAASPSPIIFGGWQTPPTGGEETWLGFMGNRMSMALETPNLLPEPDGRLWTAALLDGMMEGLIVGCRFFQPGFVSKAVAPNGQHITVDGGGQAGSIINLKGFSPFAPVLRREFFSIVTAGRRALYHARVQGIADEDGKLALPIGPMLHVQPNDGDLCEFGKPMIEGKLTGDAKGWTMIPARVQGLTFTITETR